MELIKNSKLIQFLNLSFLQKLTNAFKYFIERYGTRGFWVAFRSLLSNKPALLSVKPPELNHTVLMRTHTSDIFTYDHIFRNHDYKINISRQPKVILDVGSNVGYSAVYFANQFKNTSIYTLEPEDSNFRLLSKNIRNYPNIHALKGALWFENKKIVIKDSTQNTSGFQVERIAKENTLSDRQSIQGYTLDFLMEKYSLYYIDILKIDIEGAEKEVFADPSLWIDRIGVIIIELHDRFRPGCGENFKNAVKDFDYKFERHDNFFCARKEYVKGLKGENEWESFYKPEPAYADALK